MMGCVSFFLAAALVSAVSSSAPTLSTTLGDVTGFEKTMFRMQVQGFYGIPFAAPPTGDLRFKAPQAAAAWSSPRDGTVKPPTCWQTVDTEFDRFAGVEMWNPKTKLDEDCLYLNVWRRTPESGDTPKTIMVFIHGGGFSSGSTMLDLYDGAQIAVRENVIVVTVAYRVGPLGFMYLPGGPEPIKGNAGLLDQVMALQWVKDNAESMGGSPDDITIFGQGAGAVSVGFHLFSPLSRDLFNNAIMQSGTPTVSWAVKDVQETSQRVAKLAESVSCSGEDVLSCLRAVDAKDLTDKQWALCPEGAWFDIPLGPIVDGEFLPKDPMYMLKTRDIKKTKVIIGMNLNEGIYFDVYGFPDDFPLDGEGSMPSTERYYEVVLEVCNQNTTLRRELLRTYSQEHKGANKRRMKIVDSASGDYLIKCPAVNFARDYSILGGEVYLYSFEEKISTSPWPGWMGVPHRYELEFVFGIPPTKGSTNTQGEKDLSKEIMDLWTSFAKKGAPEHDDVDWPMYTSDLEDYVKIRVKGTRVARRLRSHACLTWATYGPN